MRRRLLRLARWAVALVAIWFAAYTGVYLFWNDEAIARSINAWVSTSMKGRGGPTNQAFVIGKAHFEYWTGMRSLLFGGPANIKGWDTRIWDAQGKLVLHVPYVEAKMWLGEVVWAQFFSIFGRYNLQLHWADAVVPKGSVHLAITPTGEVNLVQAMSAKEPKKVNGGMVIRLDSAELRDVDFVMEFPGWRAHAPHVRGHGKLRVSTFPEENTDPEKFAFTYSVVPLEADEGELRLGEFVFPLRGLKATRFGAPPEATDQLQFTATASTRGAPVTVAGRLAGVYSRHSDADLAISFSDGKDLAPMLDLGGLLGGNPAGDIRIHGPFTHIVVDGAVRDAEVRLAGIAARRAKARMRVDQGKLELDEIAASLGGGRIGGQMEVDFQRLKWRGDFTVDAVDPGALQPLVPPSARGLLGGRLDGTASVSGSIARDAHPERVAVRQIEGLLRRRGGGPWPRDLRLHGDLLISPAEVRVEHAILQGDGVKVGASGVIDVQRMAARGNVSLDSARVAPLLVRLGLPPAAEALHARGRISGPLLRPLVEGEVWAEHVGMGQIRLARLDADLRLEGGRLLLAGLRSDGLGGRIGGDFEVSFWDGPFTRPRPDPSLKLRLGIEKLKLQTLTGLAGLRGDLTGQLTLDGTFHALGGAGELSLPRLEALGDVYTRGDLSLRVGGEAVEVTRLSLEREGGGRLFAAGKVGFDGKLGADVSAREFPFAAIPGIASLPVAIDGDLQGRLHFDGTVSQPLPSGTLETTAFRLRDALLGDGGIKLDSSSGTTRIKGRLFDRFDVDGTITLLPRFAIDVTIEFADMPLDSLVPEARKLAEIDAVVGGKARFAYVAGGTPSLDLRLRQVAIRLHREADESIRTTEEFRNVGDLVISSDGEKLTLKQARLRSDVGEFEMLGDISATASDLLVRGKLDLELLEYFTTALFEHTHGEATVDMRLTGPVARPKLAGTIDLRRAKLTPHTAERPLTVDGRLDFVGEELRLHHVVVELDGARAEANGRMALRDWSPGELSLSLVGELAAALLEWLWPEQVTETSGRLSVDLRLAGRWQKPTWDGSLEIRDLAFRARRLGRDLVINGGTVRLRGYEITLGCPPGVDRQTCRTVSAKIDSGGALRLDGRIALPGLELGPVDLHLSGDNLDWGSPGIYSVTLSPEVDLTGDGKGLRLAGKVMLVSGTYLQAFDYRELVLRPRTSDDGDPPFYQGVPLLEGLALNIVAASSGPLSVRNNIANMLVSVPALEISGTLAKLQFRGSILLEEGGTFKIPLLRADFITERSSLVFERGRAFPDDTPNIDLSAWADWSDRYEQFHHIVLKLRGTYRGMELDLSSTDGWDKQQVLAALLMGGSPDDVRKQVARTSSGASSSSSFDGLAKTFSNEMFGEIFESPIKNAFKLDVVRFELGYVKVCPKNTRYFKLCGQGEGQLTPTSRYDARAELRLSDDLSVQAMVEHIEHSIETFEDNINRFRLQLKWKVPLR